MFYVYRNGTFKGHYKGQYVSGSVNVAGVFTWDTTPIKEVEELVLNQLSILMGKAPWYDVHVTTQS